MARYEELTIDKGSDVAFELHLNNDDGSINYDNIVEFSASDMAFFGGFGSKKELTNGYLNYGSSVKIVRRVIGSFANSWGFGLDLGAQYHRNNWKMGILLKDIPTKIRCFLLENLYFFLGL